MPVSIRRRLIILIMICAPVALGFVFDLNPILLYLQKNIFIIQTFAQQNFFVAIAIYFVTYVLSTAVALPGMFILTAAGSAIFGLPLSILLTALSSAMGSTMGMLIVRYFFQERAQKLSHPKLERLNKEIEKDGLRFLFTMRLLPFVPYYLLNLAAALSRMRPSVFFLATFFGMIPIHSCFAIVGQSFMTAVHVQDLVRFDLLLGCTLIALVLILFALIQRVLKGKKISRETFLFWR